VGADAGDLGGRLRFLDSPGHDEWPSTDLDAPEQDVATIFWNTFAASWVDTPST
jgi:hypothetical protein